MNHQLYKTFFFVFLSSLFIHSSCLSEEKKRYKLEREFFEVFYVGSFEFAVHEIKKTDNESGNVRILYDTTLLNLREYCPEFCDEYYKEQKRKQFDGEFQYY